MGQSAEKCIEKKCARELISLRKDQLALRSCTRNCHTNQKCIDKCMLANG